MKILLKNAMVITMNEKREVYREGNILIEDDKIKEIGHFNGPDDCDEVMDCKGENDHAQLCEHPYPYVPAACQRAGGRRGSSHLASGAHLAL